MVSVIENMCFPLEDSSDTAHVLVSVRDFATQAGFNAVQNTLVSTAVSELSTNIIKYAGRGCIRVDLVSDGLKEGLRIVAEDSGPGIADVDRAVNRVYSTGNSLGLGLPSVKRIMDSFDIVTAPGKGTRIDVTKWREC
ncbi:MAG: anti-sigma regulatory factor [Spirochaetales bacterium]|nr:anti-sigma regulatory factor [Spirochaetales bacterium]